MRVDELEKKLEYINECVNNLHTYTHDLIIDTECENILDTIKNIKNALNSTKE